MKVTSTNQNEFKPIKLEITIESKDELYFFLSLFNASDAQFYSMAQTWKSKLVPSEIELPEISPNALYMELKKHINK